MSDAAVRLQSKVVSIPSFADTAPCPVRLNQHFKVRPSRIAVGLSHPHCHGLALRCRHGDTLAQTQSCSESVRAMQNQEGQMQRRIALYFVQTGRRHVRVPVHTYLLQFPLQSSANSPFSPARRPQTDRLVPRGYADMLERHIVLLKAAVQEMYAQLQHCHAWVGPVLSETIGHPSIHDILAALDLRQHADEGDHHGNVCKPGVAALHH